MKSIQVYHRMIIYRGSKSYPSFIGVPTNVGDYVIACSRDELAEIAIALSVAIDREGLKEGSNWWNMQKLIDERFEQEDDYNNNNNKRQQQQQQQ